MQIKRLKLSGFKSFVEPAELRIEPGLTGVVGPNGCGKSNVLEAIRWVMGESSPKSMRGAGMDDVIFAGTAARPARDFAEVSLLVEREAEDMPGDVTLAPVGDVEVTRRIERGAGSAYRVNGRDVRAKDVALLFADAATGAHSPALVSQGKISAVIAAKPTERRLMLEEAAGISGLHVRRKDAEQKLRAAEANLIRLDELLADMEMRASALRRQAKAAERYRKLSDQIRIAEGRMIFARWREAAEAADFAKREAESAAAAVEKASEAQRSAAAWQTEAARALADLRSAAQPRATARPRSATSSPHCAPSATESPAASRSSASGAPRCTATGPARPLSGRTPKRRLARLEQEGRDIAERLAAAEAARGTIDVRTVELEDEAREAEAELGKARAVQAAEQAEARVARAALEAAAARLARAEMESRRLEEQMSGLGEEAPLVEGLKAARARREAAEARLEAAGEAIGAAEARRQQAASARDSAESDGSAARAALAALESEAKALIKAVEGTGGDRAINHVKAEPGYERALAAALGDDLEAALEGDRPGAGRRRQPPRRPGASGRLRAAGRPCPGAGGPAPPPRAGRRGRAGRRHRPRRRPAPRHPRRPPAPLGRLRRHRARRRRGGAADPGQPSRRDRAGAAGRRRRGRLRPGAHRRRPRRDGKGPRRRRFRPARRGRGFGRDPRGRPGGGQCAVEIERLELRRTGLAERIEQAAQDLAEARRGDEEARHVAAALPDAAATEPGWRSCAGPRRTRSRGSPSARRGRDPRPRGQRRQAARRGRGKEKPPTGGSRARPTPASAIPIWARASPRPRPRPSGSPTLRTRSAAGSRRSRPKASRRARRRRRRRRPSGRASRRCATPRPGSPRSARRSRPPARRAPEPPPATKIRKRAGSRWAGSPASASNARRRSCPRRLGFDEATIVPAADESGRHERLAAERERIGPVNLIAERELTELDESRAASQAEREELGLAINRLRGSIGSLNREGRARLLTAFEAVDRHFRSLFTTLFEGGQAHLELVESDDPLEAGLEIMAQPPGKRLSTLTLLSGGEQALTAIALIFALFLTNPAPICVLDEVDAPLDDANIERFCDLLDRMVNETDTRYLIVTHNAVTMSRMHRLFGVTMMKGVEKRLLAAE
jgi:chromosome segregation protein